MYYKHFNRLYGSEMNASDHYDQYKRLSDIKSDHWPKITEPALYHNKFEHRLFIFCSNNEKLLPLLFNGVVRRVYIKDAKLMKIIFIRIRTVVVGISMCWKRPLKRPSRT
jgi:hypothetical protein